MSRAQLTSTVEQSSGGVVPPFTAGKNVIINGDMRVSQRGSSIAVGGYTLDRWVITGSGTATQTAFTPGTAPVAGYEAPYYLNWTITANNQNSEIIQRVEDVRTFAGQTVTLSFWARSTVGAQLLNVNIYQNFGSGGSSLVGTSVNGTVTPNGTWTRYTFTGAIPSVAGKTIGTGSFLWVRVAQLTATTTNTSLDIWGVQLEAGPVATPFQTASGTLQGELALCQRYYYRWTNVGLIYSCMAMGAGYSSSAVQIIYQFPVTMRAAVSYTTDSLNLVCQDIATGTTYTPTAVTLNQSGNSSAQILFTGMSGITSYRQYAVYAGGNSNAYFGVSAEL